MSRQLGSFGGLSFQLGVGGLTRKGLKGGSTLRASRSSQLMCRKKG